MEPEALVQCPYDKSHQVRVSRLPYHLVKCQQNNPQVARTLATCPFNARHRVPQGKLRSHVASCPDKRQLDVPPRYGMDMFLGNRMKQPEVPTAWQGPPCQEDWEAELEELEDPPPFILNVRTNDLLLPCDSSAPAAPTSQSRGGGAAGHPRRVAERRRAQEGPRTVTAGPGWCPSLPRDRGDRGARGAVPPRPLLWGVIVPTAFKCMLQIRCLGGAVYHCPWPAAGGCTPIDFDHIGTRTHDFGGNSTETTDPVEFKSLQWFGATVRAHKASILACAPLYSWSPPPRRRGGAREPVGTCFLSIGNFSKFVEYAPCRSDPPDCP
ncbi:LOW QUALITY PROTEIN: gametocyte-specific factor 1 [Pelecanus crispus]|uniref:LOW QUALITY PROTEIN: gametocyte-specific factor 1 n=1 Tax=Pelecanus crispus TaxID=36300 RepID=UPI003F5D23F2